MKSSPTRIFENHIIRYAHAHAVDFLKKMVPPSTEAPKVLYLKGFWAFRVCADVSHCFHSTSTGADTTMGVADLSAGTAISPKNAERFSENGEHYFLGTAVFSLPTAISYTGTAISRTYLICERVVKRSWNVENVPPRSQALYLLGFRQIRERWNLFFENHFLKNQSDRS